MQKISGSMVALYERVEREIPELQRQVALVSTQLNTEIRAQTIELRAQTESRVKALRDAGFDYEKVFWNSLYFDGLVILARVALDLTAMMSGFASWSEWVTGGGWYGKNYAERLNFLMTTPGTRNTGLKAYTGHDTPFTASEVYEWLVWINDRVPAWAEYEQEFLSYVKFISDGGPASNIGGPKPENLYTQLARFLLHDHIDKLLLGGPALFFIRERQRVRDLQDHGRRR